MKTQRAILIKALNKRFIPILLAKEFLQYELTGVDRASGQIRRAFPFGRMKRRKDAELQLLDIQMDKGGATKFVLNFGVAPPRRRRMALGKVGAK